MSDDATPVQFDLNHLLDEKHHLTADTFTGLRAAVDFKMADQIHRALDGSESSIALATLAVVMATVVKVLCSDAPEGVACTVHEGIARFSHAYLHAVLRTDGDDGSLRATDHDPALH